MKDSIINSNTVHFDESGFYAESKRDWIHVAGTSDYTYSFYSSSRGKKAVDEAGILPYFKGTATHDSWSTYYKYNNCSHSLCNAHHLHELQGIYDTYNLDWAMTMKEYLSSVKKKVDEAKNKGQSEIDLELREKLLNEFDSIILHGYESTPKPTPKPKNKRGKPAHGKALCLLDRLKNRTVEIIDFLMDFNKPFDNNLVERDIRMTKLKQKISGAFRNKEMAQAFCRIRSFISTAIKPELP
jgi:transposase